MGLRLNRGTCRTPKMAVVPVVSLNPKEGTLKKGRPYLQFLSEPHHRDNKEKDGNIVSMVSKLEQATHTVLMAASFLVVKWGVGMWVGFPSAIFYYRAPLRIRPKIIPASFAFLQMRFANLCPSALSCLFPFFSTSPALGCRQVNSDATQEGATRFDLSEMEAPQPKETGQV